MGLNCNGGNECIHTRSRQKKGVLVQCYKYSLLN